MPEQRGFWEYKQECIVRMNERMKAEEIVFGTIPLPLRVLHEVELDYYCSKECLIDYMKNQEKHWDNLHQDICPRCIEDYENEDGEIVKGERKASHCECCKVCVDCECLCDCEKI